MTRIGLSVLSLLVATSNMTTPMSAQLSTPSAVGCYDVRVGAWDRRVDESTRHDMPRALALDSSANDAPNTWRLTFHSDSLEQHSSFRTPSWTLNGKSLVLVWGAKWTFTVVTLKRTASGWKGTAQEKTDAVSLWPWRRRPRAPVELTVRPCS
jgi:hypothetical protein